VKRALREIHSDILILGSGGAGLFAALHAHQSAPELSIGVAVKGLLGKCGCTRMVQGGYNVALAPGDSIERHFMDTIEGGKWLPDQELAWKLVSLAVERIRELENELGCFFDRNPDGTIHQKAFAGQSFDRTVHKGDLTGIEIINRLAEQVWARNIKRLEEHRAVELIKSSSGDALAGVLMIDIDRFKRLNDTFGHAVGDHVLREVAQAIAGAVREDDVPARFGGEEFAVLLRNPTPEVALEVGERVRRSVGSLDLRKLGVPGVSVSVGVSVASDPEQALEAVIDEADRALYRAKRGGRDRVVAA